ncbi:hypothetical protein Fot_24386 [Forsythia ovata]|uniref:Uncharacterized protein n=1 Tax=Forsythia ovata TaxID=205694 RepID=A0ABD1U6S2_9LAMI
MDMAQKQSCPMPMPWPKVREMHEVMRTFGETELSDGVIGGSRRASRGSIGTGESIEIHMIYIDVGDAGNRSGYELLGIGVIGGIRKAGRSGTTAGGDIDIQMA